MTDLVPVEPLPVPNPDQDRWETALTLVGLWLGEASGNTRTTYADAIGWPFYLNTVPDRKDKHGNIVKAGHSAGDLRGYRGMRYGATWLAWCLDEGVHLFDAKRAHVLNWLDDVEDAHHPDTDKPLTKRSKAAMLAAVSSFYIWAMREGHAEINPVALVNRAKKGLNTSKDKSPTRSLSKAEAHAVLTAADSDPVESVRLRSAAIVALMLIGPRVSEVCAATLADMFVQDGRRVLHVVLKGNKDHWFALPPEVCRRIDAYLASRKDVSRLPARRGQVSASTTPLFATETGGHMQRSEVWRLWERIARLSGIDDPGSVHPHVGRHTFVTEARRQGHATAAIQNSVGHEFASTTDRYGTHIMNLENSPAYGVAAAFEAGEQ